MKNKFICEVCDKSFNRPSRLTRHFTSKIHLNTLNLPASPLTVGNETIFKLNLRNRLGDINGETIVDEDIYNHIINNKYKVYRSGKYVQISCDGDKHSLHAYIFFVFHKNIKIENMVIDHINSDKLDNRMANLRHVSYSVNNYNKTKPKTASSKYYGVHFCKLSNKYRMRIEEKHNTFSFSYDNELFAAYHYDLLVKELNLQDFKKLNNIEKPEGFIKKEHNKRRTDESRGIYKNHKSSYYYKFNGKRYFGFKTPEDAINDRELKIKGSLNSAVTIENNIPIIIKRNKNNCAIFSVKKNGILDSETQIDDEVYESLYKNSFYLRNGYAFFTHKGQSSSLSRYIMNCTNPSQIVDHIDGDRLNNQKSNLRIVTRQENGQNKIAHKNSKSKYTGVCFSKRDNIWTSSVTIKGNKVSFGRFSSELDAAIARNEYVIEYNKINGTFYKVNNL